ncbi:hypothetical protein ACFXGA_25840 [Actinosynnema sp. NPDC059335]|uniref:hypothetical protein n=1 Tax=Actinosynnema sp. NPDC059335 TaxID=3346804 RepID=UPI00366F7B6A
MHPFEKELRRTLARVERWVDRPHHPVPLLDRVRIEYALASWWASGDGSDTDMAVEFVRAAAVAVDPGERRSALLDAAHHLWASLDGHGFVSSDEHVLAGLEMISTADAFRRDLGQPLSDIVPDDLPSPE